MSPPQRWMLPLRRGHGSAAKFGCKFGTSLLIVTHNLGLVTRYADRIYVMYAGRIVESGTTEEIITKPCHPYTLGLLASVPLLEETDGERLVPIDGAPPNLPNCRITVLSTRAAPTHARNVRTSPVPGTAQSGQYRTLCALPS